MIIYSLNRMKRPEEVSVYIYGCTFNMIESPGDSCLTDMMLGGKKAIVAKKLTEKVIAARMENDDISSTIIEIVEVAQSENIRNVCIPFISKYIELLPEIRTRLSSIACGMDIRIVIDNIGNPAAIESKSLIESFLKYNYIHDSGIRYSISMDEESIRERQERRKAKQDSYLSTVDTSNIGKTSIDELIQRLEEEGIELSKPFQKLLFEFIDKKGMKDIDVYKRANLDKRLFSKIRSDEAYKPSKPTVLSLCISLKLTVEEMDELLNSAGFSLSRAELGDMIVKAFISNAIYDIDELNLYLLSRNLKPLSYYG